MTCRQKSKPGELGGVSPRILSSNRKSPRADATRFTISVGHVIHGFTGSTRVKSRCSSTRDAFTVARSPTAMKLRNE